jgi:glycosyltransferase involved in cell wall biosynthesis
MHVLFRYNREPCDEPRCLGCTLAFRRPPQLWRYTGLLDRSLPCVDLFLAPSRFTLEAHRVRGLARPMRYLPHFLPSAEVAAGREGRPVHGRPYFLYVGRLERLKGVQRLIEVFRSYRRADLLVAGDGTLAAELRRQAEGLAHVHFLGRVEPADLDPLYTQAIALIVPSIGYEVFGIVVLEALARRTPAIVHRLGALPEVIEESGGGFCYRTAEELVEAMERLRRAPDLRRELGERGREAWRRLWSEEPHLQAYFAAIDEVRESGLP